MVKHTYRHIRDLSDELCREHGLSVLVPSEIGHYTGRGKSHYEWQMVKEGTSWKARMKSDMDICIREAQSYEDFICRMKAKRYAVKGRNIWR